MTDSDTIRDSDQFSQAYITREGSTIENNISMNLIAKDDASQSISGPMITQQCEYQKMNPRQKLLLFLLLLLINFTYGCLFSSIVALFPASANSILSQSAIQRVLSANGLGGILGAITFPMMINYIRRKTIYLFGLVFLGASSFFFGVVNQISDEESVIGFQVYCFLLLFLIGYSRVTTNNITNATISFLYKDNVTKKMSQNMMATSIGVLIGPIITEFTIRGAGFIIAYMIYSIFYIVLTLLILQRMPHTPTRKAGSSQFSLFQILCFPKNALNFFCLSWGSTLNRVAVTESTSYFVNYLYVQEKWIPYYSDLVSLGMLLQTILNNGLTRWLDNRIIIIVIGLGFPFIGGFMVGPLLPGVEPYSCFWVSIFAFFIFQMAPPAVTPTVTDEVLKELNVKAGEEVSLGTRDKVASLTGFFMIASWFVGPLISMVTLLFMPIYIELASLGCISLVIAIIYLFFSKQFKESIFKKKKLPTVIMTS